MLRDSYVRFRESPLCKALVTEMSKQEEEQNVLKGIDLL